MTDPSTGGLRLVSNTASTFIAGFRDAKVQDFNETVFANHNVFGFDVTMNDPAVCAAFSARAI